jgi:hypothetical protein
MIRHGLMQSPPKESWCYKNYEVSAKGIQVARILGEGEYAKICRA